MANPGRRTAGEPRANFGHSHGRGGDSVTLLADGRETTARKISGAELPPWIIVYYQDQQGEEAGQRSR